MEDLELSPSEDSPGGEGCMENNWTLCGWCAGRRLIGKVPSVSTTPEEPSPSNTDPTDTSSLKEVGIVNPEQRALSQLSNAASSGVCWDRIKKCLCLKSDVDDTNDELIQSTAEPSVSTGSTKEAIEMGSLQGQPGPSGEQRRPTAGEGSGDPKDAGKKTATVNRPGEPSKHEMTDSTTAGSPDSPLETQV